MQVDPNLNPTTEFLLNLYQEELGYHLKETKTAGPGFALIGFFSLKDFAALSPLQKTAMENLLNLKRAVKDSQGNHYFTITIAEILCKVKEFVKEIDPALDLQFELVGSSVNAILSSDPQYFARFRNNIATGLSSSAVPNPKYSYNDVDIRFNLAGWNKKMREKLSEKLLMFYAEQAKKQSANFFAHMVALEFVRSRTVNLQSFIQKKIKAALIEEYSELKSLNRVFIFSAINYQTAEERIREAADNYIRRHANQIYTTVQQSLKRHFSRGRPVNNIRINEIIPTLIRCKIFDKISNLGDEKASQYFIHGFGGMEFIGHSKLPRTHITTRDKVRISVSTGKVLPNRIAQSLSDHLLGVVRLDQEALEGMDFLKLMSYYTQGESPADYKDEERSFQPFHEILVKEKDFLTKYLKSHHAQTPLKTLCFIYNCCLALERISKPEDRQLFIENLRESLPKDATAGWGKFLQLLISGTKYKFSEVNALLQALCAIHLRKKVPPSKSFEFILRSDTSEPHFKIALRAGETTSYLYSPFKPASSLKKAVELVSASAAYRNLFCNLYQLIVNDTKEARLQVVALAEEYSLTFGQDALGLWTLVFNEHPTLSETSEIHLRASKLKLWKLENLASQELLNHAPIHYTILKASELIKEGNDLGWTILQNRKDKITQDDFEELDKLFQSLCQLPAATKNLGWHIEQFKIIFNAAQFSHETKTHWLTKGIEKIIEISQRSKELFLQNQIANWLIIFLKMPCKSSNEAKARVKLLLELFSKLRIDPASSIHKVIEVAIPSLLHQLRLSEMSEEIAKIFHLCKERSIKLSDKDPILLACQLEALLAQVKDNNIKPFNDVLALLPAVFEARKSNKYSKLLDDYIFALFMKAVDLKHVDYIVKFLAQNTDSPIVIQCKVHLNANFPKILPELLKKNTIQTILTLLNTLGNQKLNYLPTIFDYSLQTGNADDFKYLVNKFEKMTLELELTPEVKTLLQDCWQTIFDSKEKFGKFSIPSLVESIQWYGKVFSGNPTTMQCYINHLLFCKLNDHQISEIYNYCIPNSKIETDPSLELSWSLIAASHPHIYKNIFRRVLEIVESSEKLSSDTLDNIVLIIITSQKLVEKFGNEAFTLVHDIYYKLKAKANGQFLYLSIIEIFAVDESSRLRELGEDHFIHHLKQNVFPSTIEANVLASLLNTFLKKTSAVVEPYFPILRQYVPPLVNRSSQFLTAASVLLLQEWNVLIREGNTPDIVDKAVQFLLKAHVYDPLCLTTNEFITLLMFYLKELCKAGRIEEHARILDAYIHGLYPGAKDYKKLPGSSRLHEILKVKRVHKAHATILEEDKRFLSLSDYRLVLARMYIQCASLPQTPLESAAYFFDAAYDNMLHYMNFDSISMGFYLLLEDFSKCIGIHHKHFKDFGLSFILPLVAFGNQKKMFDIMPDIPLRMGLIYGVDVLVLPLNMPSHPINKTFAADRAMLFETIFNPLFKELENPKVRSHVIKYLIPMVNYVFKDNFSLFYSTFETIYPFLMNALESEDELERNLAIRLASTLNQFLTRMKFEEKFLYAKTYAQVCKKCINLIHASIEKNNFHLLFDNIFIDSYLRLILSLHVTYYRRYDESYRQDLVPIIQILVPMTTNAEFIKNFETLFFEIILASNLIVDDISKKTRALVVVKVMKKLNLLDISSSQSTHDPLVLNQLRSNYYSFTTKFLDYMVRNKVFENHVEEFKAASSYRVKKAEPVINHNKLPSPEVD